MVKMNFALVVEARHLVREALICLMKRHSFGVAGAVGSVLDIDDAAIIDKPTVSIVVAGSVADATAEVGAIKRLWPGTKIILLVEEASDAYVAMLSSQIDACMPFGVSPDAFLMTLERVQETGLRILFMEPSAGSSAPAITPVVRKMEADELAVRRFGANVGSTLHHLSDREQQILRDLARGHSNKMIARTYALAEATVKVHMKSILRKTRLANRTQAAIWAMENGYVSVEKEAA